LGRAGVQYKIVRASRPKVRQGSVLDVLTARQRDTLRLAHTMGYYDVPRRARVEDIAKALGMEKGTVGRHLRRAEKHVIDWLIV
jgi:predicted DNA binding protein